MKSARNLVILLQSRAASQNLGEPELTNSSLHVANLSLGGRGGLDPLGGLATNTTYHVGVGESLGGSLLRLHVES